MPPSVGYWMILHKTLERPALFHPFAESSKWNHHKHAQRDSGTLTIPSHAYCYPYRIDLSCYAPRPCLLPRLSWHETHAWPAEKAGKRGFNMFWMLNALISAAISVWLSTIHGSLNAFIAGPTRVQWWECWNQVHGWPMWLWLKSKNISWA